MAASTITRATWTNDTGTASAPNLDGTVINNTRLQNDVYAKIDEMFAGAGSYATFTLGGKLAVEGFGSHTISSGGTGGNILRVQNTTAGTGNFGQVLVLRDGSFGLDLKAFSSTFTTSGASLQSGTKIESDGSGGMSIVTSDAAGVIRFYTGGTTLRWGINAAGDFINGTSSHISDSVGTPTLGSGWGTSPSIAGTDYAFVITVGSAPATSNGAVTFGHTWSTIPVCVANSDGQSGVDILMSGITTTSIPNLGHASSVVLVAGEKFRVLCRGY